MYVIDETEQRTTRTPAAVMAGLAAPSQGSQDISSWRVQMAAGAVGPLHAVDRDQVWMPTGGTFIFTVAEQTFEAVPGQAVVVPAGQARQVRAGDQTAEALVCMPAGGQASVPGSTERHRLPWAE
ncbi:MAG TPA: cupin [Micromonosporaceae bacterium]